MSESEWTVVVGSITSTTITNTLLLLCSYYVYHLEEHEHAEAGADPRRVPGEGREGCGGDTGRK